MDEYDQATMEKMAETIEQCLESGNCANGQPLSKEAFETMYVLALGVKPDAVNREV
jgi:hypothetical protein